MKLSKYTYIHIQSDKNHTETSFSQQSTHTQKTLKQKLCLEKEFIASDLCLIVSSNSIINILYLILQIKVLLC